MIIEPGSKWVLIGDSITDCGRTKGIEPSNWNPQPEYGQGYVNLINAILANRYTERKIEVVNRGVGGNTIRELQERWNRDVMEEHPDWLSVGIGINDVWRGFGKAVSESLKPVPIEEYREIYDKLLQSIRPSLQGLILITPFVLIDDTQDPFRAAMDSYGKVVLEELAPKYDALSIDAQACMDSLLKNFDHSQLSPDRVHLNTVGHLALAESILKAIQA